SHRNRGRLAGRYAIRDCGQLRRQVGTGQGASRAQPLTGGAMFERLIRFAIDQRWLVLCLVALMAAVGIYQYQKLPIDAVPDITNVQVQINTAAPGYSPLETEQRVTFPIETAMAGLPNLE